ncbi:hypothetical protein QTL95_10705 [Rhizobium sp. S152]|uniref:hypothetical protein n=1 Tax=Rhizobium sp. S152 TaxID=3055038 RepID=UPI0025A9C86A|nr:hypothetical protein [Rhizobium sp. S152]MDM9626368.1 hypothetical protein [Rhizobium sp. S152]
MRLDARRMASRVAFSLVFAIFAYLGLLFGGNFSISPARGPNAVSSPAKDSQPLQISVREAVRGILAAERKAAPKYASHDSGPAMLAASPDMPVATLKSVPLATAFDPARSAPDTKDYDSHGPPLGAA